MSCRFLGAFIPVIPVSTFAVLLLLPGCATEPPPAPVTAVRCPPPPPPIYASNCVLKKDVLDVADRILDENYSYESKLVVLEKSFQALQQEVAHALEASLKSVASNQASVAIVDGRVRVRLSEELLFPSASVQISPNGLHALAQVADVLRTTPARRIEVAGHTDDRAVSRGWQDNWQLSTERARQVALFLMDHGISGGHVFIAGYADTDPADTGEGDVARAHNRRVELFIEPTAGPEPKSAPIESSFKPAPSTQ
jgi:outer membrane protein OmpA-like peptidoglycan-associated protein